MTKFLLSLLFPFALFVSVSGASDSPPSESELLELFGKLFNNSIAACDDGAGCYCEKVSATAKVPLRFVSARYCPAQIEGRPAIRFTSHDVDGNLVDEGFFIDEKKEGTWITWHSNGVKAFEAYYEQGVGSGEIRGWHDNAALEWEGQFKGGREDGIWRHYDRNGQMDREVIWNKGDLVNSTKFNSENEVRNEN